MACHNSCAASGEFLLAAGTALAIEMARCLTAEELELLAAFLEVLGDQLALLALKMSDADDESAPENPCRPSQVPSENR